MEDLENRSNATTDKYQFWRNEKGKIEYCAKCTNCRQNCEQSYKVEIYHCSDFDDHRKMTNKNHTSTKKDSLQRTKKKGSTNSLTDIKKRVIGEKWLDNQIVEVSS